MNVIFIEPSFPYNQREFVRGLNKAGANVIGIGERPAEYLNDEVRGYLAHYQQVQSVVHEPSLLSAVREIQGKVWVDRLEATVEAHIMAAARVREACGIPGTSVHTAYLCRDKPAMKEVLRKAGIPTAQSTRAEHPKTAREFAAKVGYPLIIKPVAGAGASGTWKVKNDQQLEKVIVESRLADGVEVAVEEFIEGHEGYYDTITVNGEVVHEFITHYYPNVLTAMRERWISPQMVVTNRINAPGYDELKQMGRKVIKVLDIGTSATHMEWFAGPKGLRFSEIGCRPPGVGQWDVYNAANDFDIYHEWACALVHGRAAQKPSRRFAAGHITLRPSQDGRITGYSGLEAIQSRFGDCIFAAHFPPAGSPTAPIEGGYMANAWMRMRHPDYDTLRSILDTVGETVKVHAA